MEIIIKTKFDIGEKVIAYIEGDGFRECRVLDIFPAKSFSAKNNDVKPQYICRTMESGNDIPTTKQFNECELFTIEELQNKIDIIKENW